MLILKLNRIEIKKWKTSDFGIFKTKRFYRIMINKITIDLLTVNERD